MLDKQADKGKNPAQGWWVGNEFKRLPDLLVKI
jgi:hypothetical protein